MLLTLEAQPPENAKFPPWVPVPNPQASVVLVGTVGSPVNAALKAPTLLIDCSTSLPLINNFEPFVMSIGIDLPLASSAQNFSLPPSSLKTAEFSPIWISAVDFFSSIFCPLNSNFVLPSTSFLLRGFDKLCHRNLSSGCFKFPH